MRLITEFHWNGKLSKGINSTFIALLPKVQSLQKLNDFRSVSLVGSLYKILAKFLANRLWFVVDSVISEAQIVFVKDRKILDGNLIANEVVDEARKFKNELLLFKVDFEKAYDLVDWRYLDAVMRNISFQLCGGSGSKGLNVMMGVMVQSKILTGYSIGSTNSTVFSHLRFTDDTLLLGVKSWANVRARRVVLVLFEAMSGLNVNFHKSMSVGVNIVDSWLVKAASVLGCYVSKVSFMYLASQLVVTFGGCRFGIRYDSHSY